MKPRSFNNLNEISEQSSSPFLFKQETKYYDVNFNTGYSTRYNKIILDEWYKYFEGKIKLETIQHFLLDKDTDEEIFKIYTSLKNKKQFDHIEFQHLTFDKTFNFFEFVYLAKKIEKSSISSKYSWNYDDVIIPVVDKQTINQLLSRYESLKYGFLKNRYWFQIVKAYFYSSEKQNLLLFFERTKSIEPKNKLYYRAMSYCAGIYKQQNNFAQANYMYSIIFEDNPDNRAEIANNFHIKDDKSFNSSLLLTKSKTEKIALWALYGFRADKKVAVEEIYKLNPKSEHLNYLLPKLINDEEVRLSSLVNMPSLLNLKKMKQNIDMDIISLVNRIDSEHKTLNPELWHLASEYLSIFNNHSLKNNTFDFLLKSADTHNEARALNLLCTITSLNHKSSSYGVISSDLDWLFKLKTFKKNEYYNLKNIQEYCLRHMSYINYSKQKILADNL